jgi:PAS domain-containing protein
VIEFYNSHFSWHVQKFDIIPAYHYTVKPFCFYLARGFSVIVDAVILLLCIRRFRKGVNIIKRNLMKYVIIPIILIMGARILTFFNQEYNLRVLFIQYTFLFAPFIYIGFIKNHYGVYSHFTDLLFKEVFVIQDNIFLVLNNEDKIIFANPFFYRELGYEEDEILGYDISRFLVAKNEFRLQECDVDKFNILFSARDGSTKRVIVRVSTFKNERGRILYTVLVGDNQKAETDQKFLNICAYCKNVKISGLRWVRFEEYLSDHYDLQFTHGICPECYKVIVHKYSQDRT